MARMDVDELQFVGHVQQTRTEWIRCSFGVRMGAGLGRANCHTEGERQRGPFDHMGRGQTEPTETTTTSRVT